MSSTTSKGGYWKTAHHLALAPKWHWSKNGYWPKWLLARMALTKMGFGLNGYWPNWELDQVALGEMALDEMGLDEVAIPHANQTRTVFTGHWTLSWYFAALN